MPKKILLADDSITIQKVVELTFSDGDYEVIAVNNGARAIQKLSEVRPDIILSDIIMPEKNGYEVCEFVKSHPDYRTIPVVLLTGTFEPFDPDRADKAGCDAVVTKPFESQSLMQKVEELIDQAKSNAPTAPHAAMGGAAVEKPAAAAPPPPPPAPAPSTPPPPPPSSFFSAPPPPPAADAFTHDSDIFGSAPTGAKATTEMPFASSNEPFGAPPPAEQFSGETRAFPKMTFDDLPKPPASTSSPSTTAQIPAMPAPAPPPPPAASPWDEPAPSAGETRAFPKMNFNEPPASAPSSSSFGSDDSPFGAPPPAEQFSGETRAFPKLSFDDLNKAASTPPPPPPPPPAAASPWDEPTPMSGETRGFPKMSFEDLEKAASKPSASPWDEPAAEAASAPSWPSPASEPAPATTPSFGSSPSIGDEEDEPSPPSWSSAPTPAPAASAAPAASSANGAELTEEQVDRIARRVVQLMSDQVVRNIAWEVIPDLAEMVVKERIRQLETE
jgi:CheY-like chemotaxis protein